MLADDPAWHQDRPTGVSSRLHPGQGPKTVWLTDAEVRVELPAILDLIEIDALTHQPVWWVFATVGVHQNTPVVTQLLLGAADGLDVVRLQREFRWHTPLDVVTRIVPRLIALGQDPYSWDYPVTGYPEASTPARTHGRQLSDEFLEDIALEYLQYGRGYAKQMAAAHQVSESTIASWVHKARTRGILTDTRRGAKGGQWVGKPKRRPIGDE